MGSDFNVRETSTPGAEAADSAITSRADSAAGADDLPDGIEVDLGGGELEASIEQRFAEGFQRIAADQDQFSREFLGRLAQAFFFLLPAFALLLKLAYAFVFLLMTLVSLPNLVGLGPATDWLALLLLWVPVYLLLAMKRFYAESWPKTTTSTPI